MMSSMFITVFIVLLTMTVLLFLVILKCVDKVNEVVKQSFLKHLEIYDDQIEEKSRQLSLLNKELEENQDEVMNPISNQNESETVVVDLKADYVNRDFSNDYLLVKETFKDYAYKAMVNKVNEFIDENQDDNIQELKEFITLFTYDYYYEMVQMEKDEQEEVMNVVLEHFSKVKYFFEKYKESYDEFDIKDFMDYVQDYVFSHDSIIYVYSNDGHHAIENSPKHVLYRKDQTIMEGYKVKYKDFIYDFSL